MLPFGSFLSNIPLIIIAVAYLLYFGASAVNKPKAEESPDNSSEKIQFVKAVRLTDNDKTLNYFKIFKSKSVIKVTVFTFYTDLRTPVPIPIGDRKFISCFDGLNLFSRPPPQIA